MAQRKLIIVAGSGPGIGVATGSHFASQGYNVALLSRNSTRLQEDAAKVLSRAGSGVQVRTYAVSVSDHAALGKTLEQVRSELGDPEVIFYNAARVGPSELGKYDADALVEDFKTVNVGTVIAAEWGLPLLEKAAGTSRPSFIVTAGGLQDHPIPAFFALSMVKAAQYNFLNSFAQIAGPKGIHVANVNVGGAVNEDDPVVNPKNIASKVWELHTQDKANWSEQIDVGNIEDMIAKMN